MNFPASRAVVKIAHFENFIRESERNRKVTLATAIQMPANCVSQRPPLLPDSDAPLGHEFCGPAVYPHREYLRRRLRFMNGTFFRDRLFQGRFFQYRFDQIRSALLRRHDFLWKRHGFSGRLRVMLAGDGESFIKVFGIEPLQGADALQHAIFPDPGSLDIELALLFLIAGLDAMASDRLLSAHPVDVAMQGHRYVRFPERGARRTQKSKIAGRTAFATTKAGRAG